MDNLAAARSQMGMSLGFHIVFRGTAARFATAGIHSWLLLRRGRNRFDEVAIAIGLAVGGTAVLVQGVSGDALARMVAEKQPIKLASIVLTCN